MPKESNSSLTYLAQALLAIFLGVSSEFISKQIFNDPRYETWFQNMLLSFSLVLFVWLVIIRNHYVVSIVHGLSELQNAVRTVRSLSAQYEDLNMPVTINGRARFPEAELPSVICALASGIKKGIRAIYIVTPETLRNERSHVAQEGEYFQACQAAMTRVAEERRPENVRKEDIVRRVFLISEEILSDPSLLEAARKLVDRHDLAGFGVRVICHLPTKAISDFAIYDENIVLKLEVAMFERRIASGLVSWHQSAIEKYIRIWGSLWKSAEAMTAKEFHNRRPNKRPGLSGGR